MMQADIFDYIHQRFFLPKDRPVRLFESFSGIGFQRMALEKANIPYEVVGISEIDKYALQSYQAMYGECPNLGSITEIRGEQMPKDIDVFTYSFPCQDLSKAGKQAGLGDTRSGLIYEVLRLLHEMKGNLPKVLIMENVTALYEQKFIKQWNAIRFEIEKLGYTNYAFTLNSKSFGIAQNRDRAFMVSILGEWNYVKPEEFTLTTRLKDYLELSVDESYYLSEKQINFLQTTTYRSNSLESVHELDGICKTLDTMQGGNREPKVFEPLTNYDISSREYRDNGWSNVSHPLLARDYKGQKVVLIPEATKQGYVEAHDGDVVYIDRPHQKRGVVQDGMIPTLKTSGNDIGVVVSQPQGNEAYMMKRLQEYQDKTGKIPEMFNPYNSQEITDVSPTITTMCDRWQSSATVAIIDKNIEDNKVVAVAQRGRGKDNIQNIEVSDREIANSLTTVHKDSMVGEVSKSAALTIRKLTPTETGRLMGMPEHLIKKQLKAVSKSQAYKQHGNGIVADVMAYIIGMMYYETQDRLKVVIDEYNKQHCYAFRKEKGDL